VIAEERRQERGDAELVALSQIESIRQTDGRGRRVDLDPCVAPRAVDRSSDARTLGVHELDAGPSARTERFLDDIAANDPPRLVAADVHDARPEEDVQQRRRADEDTGRDDETPGDPWVEPEPLAGRGRLDTIRVLHVRD